MPRLSTLSRALIVALTVVAFASAKARADLKIRVSSFTAGGTQQSTTTRTVVRTDPPPPLSSQTETFTLTVTNFSLVITTNIATTAAGKTDHSLTINLRYNSPGPIGVGSNKLVVEFIGLNYVIPVAGPATVSSNASPATSGLRANSVTYASGVFTGNSDLPATIGDTTGLSGTTSQSGTMGTAASVLLPNPATAPVDITGKFSFYQVFTFSQFANRNQTGNISAGSTVAAVPEPTTLAMGALAVPGLAILLWRRRRPARA